MRRNSLSRWKQFSMRCRHLYMSASCGMGTLRSSLDGMTASVPRSLSSARKALLSNALSPSSHYNSLESGCELRVQRGTRVIMLLVSFDSEVRLRACGKLGEL